MADLIVHMAWGIVVAIALSIPIGIGLAWMLSKNRPCPECWLLRCEARDVECPCEFARRADETKGGA